MMEIEPSGGPTGSPLSTPEDESMEWTDARENLTQEDFTPPSSPLHEEVVHEDINECDSPQVNDEVLQSSENSVVSVESPNVSVVSEKSPNVSVDGTDNDLNKGSVDGTDKGSQTPTLENPNVTVNASLSDDVNVSAGVSVEPKVTPKKPNLTVEGSEDDEEDHDYIVGYLGKVTDQAEARLAARRQARAEAREIRMRELERQQKEAEQSADRVYDLYSGMPPSPAEIKQQKLDTTPVRSRAAVNSQRAMLSAPPANYHSSRRSSEDSMEDGISLRDVRQELKELEEKFRKAMFHNAQLDNEKSSFVYQVELLKDQIEQLEEAHSQLQREHREKCREHEQLKRESAKIKEDMEFYKSQLEERDRLIQEHGLVIVGEDAVTSEDTSSDEDDSENSNKKSQPKKPCKALVSVESAQLLDTAGEGSLDVRLRKFLEERNELQDQVRHLKLELEEERSRHSKLERRASGSVFNMNGPDGPEMADVQREASKQLGDYKFKLQKAEQDISTLQANVARLESQVIRYKTAAETSEKAEDELKTEKRKLQREVRDAKQRQQSLEETNWALEKQVSRLRDSALTANGR